MRVHVGLVHLGHITQQVSARIHGVVPDAAHLTAEAGEAVFHLVKAHVRFGRKVADHSNGLEADGSAPFVVFFQPVFDKAGVHVQYGGQRQGVEGLHFPRGHQDVVGHFVSHQDGSVAVVDDSAGGIDGFVNGGVAVCVLLVGIVQDLEGEYLAQQQQRYHSQADQEADMTPSFVVHYFRGSGARTPRVRRDTRKLATSEAARRRPLNHNGRVPAPSAQM